MRRCRRWKRLLTATAVVVAGVGMFLGGSYRAVSACRRDTVDQVADLPRCTAALVLGTSWLARSGDANPYFTRRIDAAEAVWRSGKVDALILSGDNGTTDYNEPERMRSALAARGVPLARMRCDYAGFRTLDSVLRARSIFGQSQVIVISQPFQNERAIYLGRHHGMQVTGYNAQDVDAAYGLKTRLREILARGWCVLDVHVLGTRPRFAGPPVNLDS